MEKDPPLRGERADARRNRDKILHAARRVLVERGGRATLGEIARRAGVGTGTLYRRFPDRASLMRAVAVDILEALDAEADAAVAEEDDGFVMLARFMQWAVVLRLGAVIAALLDEPPLIEELAPIRSQVRTKFEAIIERARAEGSLRDDVASGDLGQLLVRLSRPLSGSVPDELEDQLALRHLEIVLAGIHRGGAADAMRLSGPALDMSALRRLLGEDA